MDWEKFREAESNFLQRYPGGFADPELVAIGKKHKMEKMVAQAGEFFAEDQFSNSEVLSEHFIKTVTSSSMVSVFEKPRTRDFVRSLNSDDKDRLCSSLYEMLYLDEEKGFDQLLDLLTMGKLAKWTLMTVVPAYLRPQKDVFIKPTTAKGVLKAFGIDNPVYKARPSYPFYKAYRDLINEMKAESAPELQRSENAAFCGFLMMSMEK